MINVLELFGGIGLFLFGMNLMGSSLKKLAGSGLEKILATLTTSKRKGVGAIKGWGLGLGVTGIIQSSAATTIMLIGFVNAGIMTLAQAIPVVYGSNVGSTVTAQILRLGDLGSGNLVLKLLKPSSFAPMLVAVGTFTYLFTRKQKLRDICGILVGLGTLFYGMTMMEEVFAPLKESEAFQNFFTSFSNPIIGILTGLILTAIIQSSSASVGILQALSATGSITYGIAIPLIIGQNIGKCMTILIGSIGANKKAKRVALSYLLFNIIGAIVISLIIYALYYTIGLPFFDKVVNRGNIANIHLGFNLIISVVLLPFSKQMSNLTGKLLRDSDEVYGDEELRHLDDMLLKTPGIALMQCKNLMKVMAEKIEENYDLAIGLFQNYDKAVFNTLLKNENFIDRCETALSSYIVKIERKRLTIDNQSMLIAMLNTIGDYERIGDYSMKIAYTAEECHDEKITFSAKGKRELDIISEAVHNILNMTFDAADNEDMNEAIRIQPLAKTVSDMKRLLESHHIERLQDGDCGVSGGTKLYDLANSFQKIANHAKSISRNIITRLTRDVNLDAKHGKLLDKSSEEYLSLESYYRTKYIDPMLNGDIAGTSAIDDGDTEAESSDVSYTASDSKKDSKAAKKEAKDSKKEAGKKAKDSKKEAGKKAKEEKKEAKDSKKEAGKKAKDGKKDKKDS